MSFRVTLTPAAARQLRKFDPQARRRLQAAIELLASEPRPPAATRLVGGSGEWRVRTGDYRIIYEIRDDQLVILVLQVGHRPGRLPTATLSSVVRSPAALTGPQ